MISCSLRMHKVAKLASAKRFTVDVKRQLLTVSYAHGSGNVTLLGRTIGRQLELAVEKSPDKTAVNFTKLKKKYTFSQFFAAVDDLAAAFVAQGVKKGDRIGVWGPNTPEWLLAQFATARCGAVMVNVNPHYRAAELEYALNKVQVSYLLVAEKFKHQDYYSILSEVCPELKSGKVNGSEAKAGLFKRLPNLKRCWMMVDGNKHPGALDFSELLASATNEHRRAIADNQKNLQFDDPINIQFTSGTTGNPKGATLTHHGMLNNSYFAGLRFGYHEEEAVLCAPVPFYHCLGNVLANLQIVCHNSTLVVPDLGFNAEETLAAIHTTKATSLYGTPTMFIDMMKHPRFDRYNLTSLRTGICSGAPCPPSVMRSMVERMHMPDLRIGYGTTELSPLVTLGLTTDNMEKRLNTVGKVLEHLEVKLVDSEERVVPIGQSGEVFVRGYSMMPSYWQDPQKTNESINASRWYRTGDVGLMDSEGYLRIIGRIKDMIIRGGENIYPTEIEKVLLTYRNEKGEEPFADVQIVGIPDERLGEEVCAFIRPKSANNEHPTGEQLRAFCMEKLARYKVPKHYLFLNEFPMTVSGKVQKFKLRDIGVEKLKLKIAKNN